MNEADYNGRAQALDVSRIAALSAARTQYAEAIAAAERQHSKALRELADAFLAERPSVRQ